ncbi:hypothetical protein CY34DRAFT_813843, partial [Suillus luteus UH-Slu-Lm8-n1]
MQDAIISFLHWYFDSARYFGKDGHTLKNFDIQYTVLIYAAGGGGSTIDNFYCKTGVRA